MAKLPSPTSRRSAKSIVTSSASTTPHGARSGRASRRAFRTPRDRSDGHRTTLTRAPDGRERESPASATPPISRGNSRQRSAALATTALRGCLLRAKYLTAEANSTRMGLGRVVQELCAPGLLVRATCALRIRNRGFPFQSAHIWS